jgi:hypothetical protein
MTSAAPPRTIHYPLAAKVVGHLKRDAPYDHRTIEQQLELDDTNPEDSRYYAVMVTGGWAALAFGFLIAMVLISFPVNRLLGAQVAVGWATACLVGGVFVSPAAQTLFGTCFGTSLKLAAVSDSMAPTAMPSRGPCAAASPATPA